MSKKPVKEEKKAFEPDGNLGNYRVLFIALIIFIAVINFLFQQGQRQTFIQRSWGLNDFSYFPVLAQLIILVLLVFAALPSFNGKINGQIERLGSWLDTKKAKRILRILSFGGIALVLTILLYVFKIKYDFLGDRDIRIDQSVKGIYVTDEYLTMFLMHYLNNFLSHLFHFTPHRSFVFLSIAAGFVYFFVTLLISDLLFEKHKHKIIFFLFCISISTIMVFSGYTEIYAFPAASVVVYIYAGILCLKQKINFILSFLFLAFAIALHLEQVSLIPSFVFLVIYRYKFAVKLGLPLLLALAVVAVPAIYIIYPILHLDPSTVVPLRPDPQYPDEYTLLSLTHFREFLNSQFLSSGILLLVIPMVLYTIYKKKIQLDNISKFLLINVLFSIVIVFTANSMMGSADWDICSFPAISAAMFIAYIFIKQLNTIYAPKKISYVLVFALIFNTLNCWAWIGVNASDRSIKKIKDMMTGDPGYYYQVYMPAEIHLSSTYFACKLTSEAEAAVRIGYDMYGKTYSRAAFQYVAMVLHKGDTAEAIRALKDMISRFPLAEHAMAELAVIYENRHMYVDEYILGKISEKVFAKDPQKAVQMATKPYLGHIFSYTFNYASMHNDTAVVKKTQQLLQVLQQY